MTDEKVYHVDENDSVIETVPRKTMREKKLRHRVSAVFVFNKKGELLIHKRSMSKDVHPGYYDLAVRGTVRADESYLSNAKREIAEEIGAKVVELKKNFKFRYDKPDDLTITTVYETVYDSPISFQKSEIESGEFMHIDKVKEIIKIKKFCPVSLEIFKKFIEGKKCQR